MLVRTQTATVMMAQSGLDVDHFCGLERSLAAHGIACDRLFPSQPAPRFTAATRVVVVANTEASMSRFMIRQARRLGGVSVLVMDGLVEWRNTFINPAGGQRFLRPSPVDVIACAGETDRRILTAMGNNAVATGLPRLHAMHAGERHGQLECGRRVMIATARTPAFNPDERSLLLASLRELKDCAQRMGVEVVWRVTDGLDADLGVVRDAGPLRESLSRVSGVITTASTLLIESMARGVPTALVHPYRTPVWQPSTWVYRGPAGDLHDPAIQRHRDCMQSLDNAACSALEALAQDAAARSLAVASAAELFQRLFAADDADLARQRELLADLHAPAESAAARLATLVAAHVRSPARAAHAASFMDQNAIILPATIGATPPPGHAAERSLARGLHLPDITGARPGAATPPAPAPRAVIVVACDDPSGNDPSRWARRIAGELSGAPPGFDTIVLTVVAAGDLWRRPGQPALLDALSPVCVLDPYADNVSNLDLVTRAIEALAPSLILVTNTDLGYAAAIQTRARAANQGSAVRVIGVSMESDPRSQALLNAYPVWDAALGVGRQAMDGILRLRRGWDRPVLGLSLGRGAAGINLVPDEELRDDCRRLRGLFDSLSRTAAEDRPTALGVRLVDTRHRLIQWAEDPAAALVWIDARLRESGYRHIAHGTPDPRSDCVVLESLDDPSTSQQAEQLETMGLGVVFGTTLAKPLGMHPGESGHPVEHSPVVETLRRAAAAGCKRIVLYGAGMHLCRHAGVFDLGFPIVGIMDDFPPKWSEMFGVTVVAPPKVMQTLRPDAIVLFSDIHESRMWTGSERFRRIGVRVFPIYNSFGDDPVGRTAAAVVPLAAASIGH